MYRTAYLPKVIFTERLILLPFTTEICKNILNQNFEILHHLGLKQGINWPDEDMLETLPKVINNLSKVTAPTGFESWMIIKKETNEIIGDAGFKGFNFIENSTDIGYGVIEAERNKGFAVEATKALIDWVSKIDESITITASTLIGNNDSIKLLQKLNFEEVDRDENYIFWSL